MEENVEYGKGFVFSGNPKTSISHRSPHAILPWEKLCIEACIDSLQPYGDVLEVGFSSSFSSSYIQTFFPKCHTIIENQFMPYRLAHEWASHHMNISLLKGCYQSPSLELGFYDAIFYDHIVAGECRRSKEFTQNLVDVLYESVYQDRDVDLDFLCDDPKYQYLLRKIHATLYFGMAERENRAFLSKFFQRLLKPGQGKELQEFTEKCLYNHMRKDSRLTLYLTSLSEHFEGRRWFDTIITNPFVEYEERAILLDPFNRKGMGDLRAFLITITKK